MSIRTQILQFTNIVLKEINEHVVKVFKLYKSLFSGIPHIGKNCKSMDKQEFSVIYALILDDVAVQLKAQGITLELKSNAILIKGKNPIKAIDTINNSGIIESDYNPKN